MTSHDDRSGRWTDRRVPVVPDEESEGGSAVLVPLLPDGHPGAVVTAVQAFRAVLAFQHLGELGELSADELRGLLVDVAHLRAAVEFLEEALTLAYRDAGASWAELDTALRQTRLSAKERYRRLSDPSRPAPADDDAARLAWIRDYARAETAGMSDVEALAFAVVVEADHLAYTEEAADGPAGWSVEDLTAPARVSLRVELDEHGGTLLPPNSRRATVRLYATVPADAIGGEREPTEKRRTEFSLPWVVAAALAAVVNGRPWPPAIPYDDPYSDLE